MTEFTPSLRGDALADYLRQITEDDTVTVEVTLNDRVSVVTGPCWEEGSDLYFLLRNMLRDRDGNPSVYITALLAHEPTVVLPTGLHAVVRLTRWIDSEPGPGWTAARMARTAAHHPPSIKPWMACLNGIAYETCTDDEITAVYAETLYEGLAVES